MAILPADAEGIRIATATLRAGELVGMPTETVYGLAADATRPDTIARVFQRKGRPLFDPLIVHLAAGPIADRLAGWIHADAIPALAAWTPSFWPGPLTVVAQRDPRVHDLITAGLDTVAVRIPNHPVAQALLSAFGPVVAPSANRFGRISPTTAQAVIEELGDIPVLDGGPCAVGVESTILHVPLDGPPRILRPGGTPAAALVATLGPLGTRLPTGAPISPGQLPSHYAPRTPVILEPSWSHHRAPAAPFAVLDHAGARCPFPGATTTHTLPAAPVEAAQQLFAALRALDQAQAEFLLIVPFPTHDGLGSAINDRLRRAATPPTPS